MILHNATEMEMSILAKFQSLTALEVANMATSSAASDENFIKMTTFPFQWPTVDAKYCEHPQIAVRCCPSHCVCIYSYSAHEHLFVLRSWRP